MNKLTPNQRGFIPMMLSILAVIAFIIVMVYLRVAEVSK